MARRGVRLDSVEEKDLDARATQRLDSSFGMTCSDDAGVGDDEHATAAMLTCQLSEAVDRSRSEDDRGTRMKLEHRNAHVRSDPCRQTILVPAPVVERSALTGSSMGESGSVDPDNDVLLEAPEGADVTHAVPGIGIDWT